VEDDEEEKSKVSQLDLQPQFCSATIAAMAVRALGFGCAATRKNFKLEEMYTSRTFVLIYISSIYIFLYYISSIYSN